MLLLALVMVTGAVCAPVDEPPPSRWSGSAPAIDNVSDRGSWRLPPQETRAPFVTSGREPPPPPPYYREEPQRRVAPRRIVYYADLPDVGPKYTRQSRYEGSDRRDLPYGRAPAPSYTIIDADVDGDRKHLPATRGVEYAHQQAPLPDSRYNRIPAPYQPEYRRQPPQDFPYQPSEPAYRRPAPVEPQYRRPLPLAPETQPRRPDDERRLLQAGELYQRQPPEDDPYRDYNPRQPAPWSMQIGARLTVKDDGRRPSAAGRRFYVQSQEPGAHYASVRYPPPRN